MTTGIKIRTNGNYVTELKNTGGTIVGSVGPGSNVESDWIWIHHGETYTTSERKATDEEQAKWEESQKPVTGNAEA